MKMVEEVRSKVKELGGDWNARKVEQAIFVDSVVEKHGLQDEFSAFITQELENGNDEDDTASPPVEAEDSDKTPPPEVGIDEDEDDNTLSPPTTSTKKKRKNSVRKGGTRKSARLGGKTSATR